MKASQIGTILLTTTITAFIFGCTAADVATSGEANMAKKQDPMEEVRAALVEYHEAQEASDLERMIAAFSENYSNLRGANKSDIRRYFEAAIAEGIYRSVATDMGGCSVTIGGDVATAEPILYWSPPGGTAYSYRLRKEADGAWRIINSEQMGHLAAAIEGADDGLPVTDEDAADASHLVDVEYPDRECSYMAATLGAARSIGYDGSEAWLYGSCGMAFFSHGKEDDVCWSYPTDWNYYRIIPLLRNAGIAQEPVIAPDGDIGKAVKAVLRKGLPVSGWSDILFEQVLIRGYAATPQGETVKYLFLNPEEENVFHPWEQLSAPVQFSLVPPADDRAIVRSGLRCAVDMNRNPRRFARSPEMAMGYEAYRATAEYLGKKTELGEEFGYNIQVWEECRRNAVAFLAEANSRLNDPKLGKRFKAAEQGIGIVHRELEAIVGTFLNPGVPKGMHDDYAKHLRNAFKAEKKAIETIEAILRLME